ncbi:MAG: hypothetical protein GYA17_01070 [Chloroflexi bacterium]|jgi:ABC-type sugar transport system permease subunit|nr:hypothetical protein [Anaerolineaceae bacterium]NMB86916.1 hypothetical protein [Chloroflexota bacterium]
MDQSGEVPRAAGDEALEPAPGAVEAQTNGGGKAWIAVVAVVVILAVLIAGVVFLVNQDSAGTSHIRDIFIILMALESLVIGVALVILIVQLAILINLLQNEIRPIVKSTNETVNTLRGTVTFMSNNLTEPVIKLNQYLAGLKKISELVRPGRQ